ncbi:hypothetical protein [Mesorhizobium sp.]|uniref:hypothetical protein n=1 Tax=Mesorhizobium sp. TaxID=1871066 RepID=UPI0033901F1D
MESGALVAPSERVAADWFLNLLIGDLQIRRVIHSLPVPSDKDVRSRVVAAISAFKSFAAHGGNNRSVPVPRVRWAGRRRSRPSTGRGRNQIQASPDRGLPSSFLASFMFGKKTVSSPSSGR